MVLSFQNDHSRHVNCRHFLMMLVVATLSLLSTEVNAWVPSASTIPTIYRSSSISTQTRTMTTTTTTTTRLHMAVSSCFAEEQGRELVERFGAVWEDEVEKIFAYETLQLSESKDRILDTALEYIQKTAKESRLLATRRWKVRLPSRRTTVGCFGRILAEMNSGRLVIDNTGKNKETTETDPLEPDEKARRNLNFLFELLSTHQTGVWGLEREMIQTAGIEHFGQDYGQTKQTK